MFSLFCLSQQSSSSSKNRPNFWQLLVPHTSSPRHPAWGPANSIPGLCLKGENEESYCWPVGQSVNRLTYRHCNLHPLRRKDSPACNTAPPSACCRHTGGLLVTGNTIVERCNLPWSANPTVIVTWQWLQRDGFIIVPRQLWRWRDRRQRGTSDTWGW